MLKNVRISYLVGPLFYIMAAVACWVHVAVAYGILLLVPILFLFPLDKENKHSA
ncbi:MAG: hypothetical protein IPK62_12565 [Bacteroidetes bacterium]|nr:hypothetical protein [Bacteroidota bacterium]